MSSPIAPPKCVTITHATIDPSAQDGSHAEPGVEILVDSLDGDYLFGGMLKKTPVGTHISVPLSNDEP